MREWLSLFGPRTKGRFLVALLLSSGLTLADGWPAAELVGIGSALADDDDGGDDGDDDGDDHGGGRSDASDSGGRSLFRMFGNAPRAPRRARSSVADLPIQDPDEIVGSGFTALQLDQLSAAGFEIIERQALSAVNTEVVKLRIPSSLALNAARELAATLAPQARIDFNHYYRPEQSPDLRCGTADCLARTVIGWPAEQEGEGTCASEVRIGLVDTAVNADHGVFAGSSIETIRLADDTLPDSGQQHGTAVAALLVGATTSRTPGLVPGATLIAVDPFYRARGQDDRSEAYNLVRALDLLAEREVEVINLSLAGPANLLLEEAVRRVSERGIIIVAAVGNAGPRSEPSYPAAYEEVVAVTAIDRNKNPYRRAGRGQHIDLAAPGVAVWTAASVSGGRAKTGTSFAAPFVTAAAARMKGASPGLAPERIRDALTRSAEDLGEPGKDPIFGWGLLNARTLCGA
ncbi:subtilase family protein [Rhizobium azibense]|nr:subtilase family protein [Rhizobium azibense]